MQQMWDRIEGLRGLQLWTARGKRFQVLTVSHGKAVTVAPESSGLPRSIRSREFEAAYRLRLVSGPLTASALRKAGASEWNPVYVAAIINAIA